MLGGIISMISPFRTYSNARRSAAFGNPEPEEAEEPEQDGQDTDEDMAQDEDTKQAQDDQIEQLQDDLESQPLPQTQEETQQPSRQLAVPPSSAPILESPTIGRSRPMMQADNTSLRPPASPRISAPGPSQQSSSSYSHALPPVSPVRGRHSLATHPSVPSTPIEQQPYGHSRAIVGSSPVSRNYDLLARFFAEKQRENSGAPSALTEVEVEGCIKLIEESMAAGRDLASEFGHPELRSNFDGSSRASSLAPRSEVQPASHTPFGSLFHPGSIAPVSKAYSSFLAPRSSSLNSITAASGRRHRPLYLGPGIGSSSTALQRRRALGASKSLADSLTQSKRGWLPKSTSETTIAGPSSDASKDIFSGTMTEATKEDGKRRKTDAVDEQPKTPRVSTTAVPSTITTSVTPTANPSTNGTKAGGSQYVNGVRTAQTSTPVRTSNRTANAVLDILKDSPPVRPVQPELVNPYQTTSSLAKVPKKPRASTPSKAARASITTRAKAKEAAAAQKEEQKPESVVDLIERTAPKGKRGKDTSDDKEPKKKAQQDKTEESSKAETDKAAAEARKAEMTEEARRRIAALSQQKEQPSPAPAAAESKPPFSFSFSSPPSQQQQQQPASTTPTSSPSSNSTFTFTPSKPSTLAPQLPAQYTATKPKKPSPLSAAFQAPDSPSSESEKSANNSPVPVSKPVFAPTAPATSFSFSALASTGAQSANSKAAPAPAPTPFSFGGALSKPATAPEVKAPASETKPSAAPSFSFSPVSADVRKDEPKFATAPAPGLSAPVKKSEGPTSPRSEALSLSETSLPRFDFSSTAARGPSVQDAESEAIKKEVLALAEPSLEKFDFVFRAGTPSSDIKTKSVDAQPQSQAPSFSFSSKPATSSGTTPASNTGFSFSKPAASSATGATPSFSFNAAPATQSSSPSPSVGFSFTPVTGSAASSAPVSGTTTPADTSDAASPAESAAATSDAGATSGLLGEGEGEEDEDVTHDARAKFWKFDQEGKSWKDLGIGFVKLKKHKETGKHRMLVRNEANGKVVVVSPPKYL